MRVSHNKIVMLEGAETSASGPNQTITKNGYEHVTSLEEADCYLAFLTQTYPKNGKYGFNYLIEMK